MLPTMLIQQEWKSCSVGCSFGFSSEKQPDAGFGIPQPAGTASVHRSMESAQYYIENNIAHARRWVSTILIDLAGNFTRQIP